MGIVSEPRGQGKGFPGVCARAASRREGGRAWPARLNAKRRGDRFARFKASVELVGKLLRLIWGGRSGSPHGPTRSAGL